MIKINKYILKLNNNSNEKLADNNDLIILKRYVIFR